MRNAYTNYQQSVSRFPFNRLSVETNRAFTALTESVDLWLERGVNQGEIYAIHHLWTRFPEMDGSDPITPSQRHLEGSLRMSIDWMQFLISVSDEECLEPFVPRIIPSFQPYADAIVAAAMDEVPHVSENFKMSFQTKQESIDATQKFVEVINACAGVSTTETCIKNFVNI